MAAVDVATTAGLTAAVALGGDNDETREVAAIAMSAFAESLAAAGCLSAPAAAVEPLTLEGAARLLCELSRHVRLSVPDEDYGQLLEAAAMVDFAWSQALVNGIPPADRSRAEEARRLLLAHHRL